MAHGELMNQEKLIRNTTILLTFVAGFCDTVTFVSVNELFSAHVTGNFIVFAYDITRNADGGAWIKLLTFPVFIAAVITGGFAVTKTERKYALLVAEGFLLLISGMAAYLMDVYAVLPAGNWNLYLPAMIIVFAMGLQNAFGKLFGKETYGPTTMMTGNVTQAALDLGQLFKTSFLNVEIRKGFGSQVITIGGFLAGCLAGAVLGQLLGLLAVVVPGGMLVILFLRRK